MKPCSFQSVLPGCQGREKKAWGGGGGGGGGGGEAGLGCRYHYTLFIELFFFPLALAMRNLPPTSLPGRPLTGLTGRNWTTGV